MSKPEPRRQRPAAVAAVPPRLPRRPRRPSTFADGPARRRKPGPPGSYDARPWLASYPQGVPAEVEAPDVPLTALLDDAAASHGQTTAVAFLGETLTYAELRETVDAFAAGLRSCGVTRGDRVALVLPTCPQLVVAFFATLRLGAVAVPCDPRQPSGELGEQLAAARPAVVVCIDTAWERFAPVRARVGARAVVVTSLVDYLPARARLGLRLPLPRSRRRRAALTAPLPEGAQARRFLELVRTGAAAPARQVRVTPSDDVAALLWTAGTTAAPRGVVLTHRNLVAAAHQYRRWLPDAVPGEERTLVALPLTSAFGLTAALTTTVLLAGRLVLLPDADPDRLLEATRAHRPTLLPGVPPVFRALLARLAAPGTAPVGLSGVRAALVGVSTLPTDLADDVEAATGGRLVAAYGTTETAGSTLCAPVAGERRPGSAGLPLPGTRCRVLALDDPTREVPVGEPGELAVAGPQVCVGYWGSDDALPATEDGFLRTGDVVVMDADGWFSVVDRAADLVTSGGLHVYPSAVEAVLRADPAVAEAVVAAAPDAERGEALHAWVVPQPGQRIAVEGLLARCEEELPPAAVPHAVHVREDLPTSAAGTPVRRALVAELAPHEEPTPRRRAAPPVLGRGPHPQRRPGSAPDGPQSTSRSTRRARPPVARLPAGDPAAEPLRRRRPPGERRRADRPPPPA